MNLVAIFAFATFTTLAAASSTGLKPPELQHQIQEKGAKAVAEALFANKSSWATLTKNVRSGKSAWIDVAVRLRSGTDGGASSELQDALFAALAKNPRHVLQVSAPTVPIKVLCSGRSDPLPTANAAFSEIDRIQGAVGRVQDKHLVEQQKDCLNALEEAKTNTKRFFKD